MLRQIEKLLQMLIIHLNISHFDIYKQISTETLPQNFHCENPFSVPLLSIQFFVFPFDFHRVCIHRARIYLIPLEVVLNVSDAIWVFIEQIFTSRRSKATKKTRSHHTQIETLLEVLTVSITNLKCQTIIIMNILYHALLYVLTICIYLHNICSAY